MKKNNTYLFNDEIDIRNLIQNLWQHKILILSISILSMLLAYIIPVKDNNHNYFKSIIAVKKNLQNIFAPYQNIFAPYQRIYINNDLSKSNFYIDFNEEFNEQFVKNFKDLINIDSFLKKNEYFNDLKIFLTSQKITASYYFYNKNFGVENNSDMNNLFFFIILPKKFNGDKFLESYLNFIFDQTKTSIKNKINKEMDDIIIKNENALAFSKKFDSIDLNKKLLENQNERYIDKYTLLFTQDELTQKISSLKELKFLLDDHMSNLNLNAIYITNQSFSQVSESYLLNINPLLGLILGFLLSLVIILLRKFF